MEHEDLLVFAFHAHTRPSNTPTALVSCYFEAVFIQVGLEFFLGQVTVGIRTAEIPRQKNRMTAEQIHHVPMSASKIGVQLRDHSLHAIATKIIPDRIHGIARST